MGVSPFMCVRKMCVCVGASVCGCVCVWVGGCPWVSVSPLM